MNALLYRITLNPNVLNGKPSIRNMRFGVTHLLDLLAAGMTPGEILADYPFLEEDDIRACLLYAARISDAGSVTPLAA